jgi:dihydropteroate synthase
VYDDVVAEVIGELRAARRAEIERGVDAEQIVLDPGFGFAKTPEHTFKIFRHLPSIAGQCHPVMVGPSRKRFLGAVTGRDVAERDFSTVAAAVAAYMLGASIFRVHAVAPVRDALAVANAVRGP